jgi:ADP-ribose pyrophosphatase YjhB (NUDIX family)
VIKCEFENGNEAYLRHAVVDVLVLKDDSILLVKRSKNFLEGGKWSLPGGFVNRGENLKQAAQREVFEETGCKISDIKLLQINDEPDRPMEDRQNIAFVFTCAVGEKTQEGDNEVVDLQWFSLSTLPEKSQIAFDHYKNICRYLEMKKI